MEPPSGEADAIAALGALTGVMCVASAIVHRLVVKTDDLADLAARITDLGWPAGVQEEDRDVPWGTAPRRTAPAAQDQEVAPVAITRVAGRVQRR